MVYEKVGHAPYIRFPFSLAQSRTTALMHFHVCRAAAATTLPNFISDKTRVTYGSYIEPKDGKARKGRPCEQICN